LQFVSAAEWYAAGVEQRSIAKRSVGPDLASTDRSRCKREGHEPLKTASQ